MSQETQLKDDVAQEACRHGSVRVQRLHEGSMLHWAAGGGLQAHRCLHQSTLHGMARPSTVNWLVSVGSNAMPLSVSRCRESTSNFQDLPFSAISLDVRQNCRREQHGRQHG